MITTATHQVQQLDSAPVPIVAAIREALFVSTTETADMERSKNRMNRIPTKSLSNMRAALFLITLHTSNHIPTITRRSQTQLPTTTTVSRHSSRATPAMRLIKSPRRRLKLYLILGSSLPPQLLTSLAGTANMSSTHHRRSLTDPLQTTPSSPSASSTPAMYSLLSFPIEPWRSKQLA